MPGDGLLFKKTTNRLLDRIRAGNRTRERLPSEVRLADDLGVSRTTIRKVLRHLEDLGVLAFQVGAKSVARKPRKLDYFPLDGDAITRSEEAERFILSKLSEKELRPGERFPELALVRESGCNRAAIREALIKVSQYRLIEKTPRQQWRVVGLDENLVDELMQMRSMFEEFAVRQVLALPDESPVRASLRKQLATHKRYSRARDPEAKSFQAMDKGLHQTCLSACNNRFVENFIAVCNFFIDYQLRPRKLRSKRIDQAVEQHIAIIEALLAQDEERAQDAMRRHMVSVHQLLLESINLDR